MQVLVQQKGSRLYFKDIDAWTPDPLAAMDFGTSNRAIDFCLANQISGVQLLLKFQGERYDVVLPLAAQRGRNTQQGQRARG